MSLNIKDISRNLTKVVSQLIGYRLTQVRGEGGSSVPAVFLSETPAHSPSYPYALVIDTNVIPVGRDRRDRYLDANLDEVVITESVGIFNISIVGSGDEDVQGILEEFKARMYSTRGCSIFKECLPEGVELFNIQQVVKTTTPLQTDFREVARVIVELSMVNVLVDETTGTIDRLEMDGRTYDDFDQVELPHEIVTNVPLNSGV